MKKAKGLFKNRKKMVFILAAVIVSGLVIYGFSSFAAQTASRARVVKQADSRLGKVAISYGRNGAGGWGPNKFHSAGLAYWAHVTAGNSYMRRVGRGTVARYWRLGKRTTKIRAGDLLFFKQPGSRSRRPVMVAVFCGEKFFSFASSSCHKVMHGRFNNTIPCNDTRRTFQENYLGAKDYIQGNVTYLRQGDSENISEEDEGIDEEELLKEN